MEARRCHANPAAGVGSDTTADGVHAALPRTNPSGMVWAFGALVLGAVAMGASPLFVRLSDVGPQASAFWRTALALPFLYLWAWFERRPDGHANPRFHRTAILAGVLFAGDLFFWHLSILGTTVANATFLATTSPLWVALGAWLLGSEAVGRSTLAGLGLCILGGVALIGESYGFVPGRFLGDIYGAVTAIFFGGHILAMREGRMHLAAARLSFVSTAIAACCLLAVAAALEPRLLPRSAAGIALLLALALVSQVGGQGLLAVALGALPATFSSVVIFMEAVVAAALGYVFLGEPLGAVQAFGGVLIFIGIWVARPRGTNANFPIASK
jgi:drug/metabolite transporter (DMT)-like permease